METLLSSLTGFTGWLFRTSCQTAIVIGLVLLAQWLLQKKLPPRWRYGLWSLVLIRLLLPVLPGSAFSIFNYTQGVRVLAPGTARAAADLPAEPSRTALVSAPTASTNAVPLAQDGSSQSRPALAAGQSTIGTAVGPRQLGPGGVSASIPARLDSAASPFPTGKQTLASRSTVNAAPLAPAPPTGERVAEGRMSENAPRSTLHAWLSLLWLGGALFLLARIIWFPLRLNAELARHETATRPAVFEILEQSKRLIGVNQVLPIIQSRAVASPALLGFIRPWLLLPEGMVDRFTPEELRFVFLHELAHLKRRDIAVNWLMTILQILHWFNPLVWFAFSRMRADRELACDELALSFAQANENKSYGQAIIKLLEDFTRPAVLPGLVGILEDKQQMKRRITMIAQFKQMTQWSVVASTLLLTLGLVTLTDAESSQDTTKSEAKTAPKRNAGPRLKTLFSGGNEGLGVLAPDESKIAYVDWGVGWVDLMVRDITTKTGKATRLTHAKMRTTEVYEYPWQPVWSPDSKWIAYQWLHVSISGTNFLASAPAEGGETKVLKAYDPEISYAPEDWSPDGQYLLCDLEKRGHSPALGLVSVESGQVRELISLPSKPAHARFSPDGKSIVFERTDDGNRDIYLLGVDGAPVIRLTDSNADDGKPIWSADGNYILFSSDRRSNWDLWATEIRSGKAVGEPFVVKYGIADCAKRRTSTGRLAFTTETQNRDVYSVAIDPATGETTGLPRLISKSAYGQHQLPVWSPDGNQIAYTRGTTFMHWLCIQSIKDGREECFEVGVNGIFGIQWTPREKIFALDVSLKSGSYGMGLFSLETRELKPVIEHMTTNGRKSIGQDVMAIKWDGNGGKPEPIAINIETGAQRRMALLSGVDTVAYDTSLDQSRIVYVQNDRDAKQQILIIYDLKSYEKKIVARGRGPGPAFAGDLSYARWSPDGSKIAYNHNESEDTPRQVRLVAANGTWEKAVKTGNLVVAGGFPPAWSPDGTHLALTLAEKKFTELAVLENYLPQGTLAARQAKVLPGASGGPVVRTLLTGGALAPDESKVTYDEWSGNSADVKVKDLQSGVITRVTNAATNTSGSGEFPASELVWSPDSKQIAYCWYWWDQNQSTNNGNDLRIASAGGDQIKVIKSHNPEMQYNPVDWSTDGQSLLCELKNKDGTAALVIVSIDSGGVRQLLSLPWEQRPRHTRLSPDGKFITYERWENGNRDVYILAVEGIQASRLTDWPSEEGGPVWSPDGKYVLFSSNRSGAWQLLGIEVKNGQAVEGPVVIRNDFGDHAKRITHSGNLAFDLSGGMGMDVYVIDVNPATGESSSPKLVTKSYYGQHIRSAWSADGQKLAYLRWREEGTAALLCLLSLKDGREECFETGMRLANSVFLSPDGKLAALGPSGKGGKFGIHLFSIATHELRPLVLSGDFRPRGFTADGKEFLLFQAGTRNENVAVDITTGQERKIQFAEKMDHMNYDLSPDGTRIVYVLKEPDSKRSQLVLANRDFKDKQVIAQASKPGGYSIDRPQWSPDGTMISYKESQDGKTELRIRAMDGRWERTVATGKLEMAYWPEWSPDSRKLAVTLYEKGVSEIGILENFLPNKAKLAAK